MLGDGELRSGIERGSVLIHIFCDEHKAAHGDGTAPCAFDKPFILEFFDIAAERHAGAIGEDLFKLAQLDFALSSEKIFDDLPSVGFHVVTSPLKMQRCNGKGGYFSRISRFFGVLMVKYRQSLSQKTLSVS